MFLTIDPVAAEPSPRLPEVLATWVDPLEAANSALGAPTLRQRTSAAGSVGTEGRQADGTVPLLEVAPPEVHRAYDQWLDRWRVWAEADRRTAVHRSWYETLADAYQQLDQHSDEVELVLSAGLLAWKKLSGDNVRTHLLNTRAQITVDADTGRLEVLVDPNATTCIADRELLGGETGFDSNRADPIRQLLRESVPAPLDDDVKEILER